MFTRFEFEIIGSNMYVFCENNKAFIVDPNINEDALKMLVRNKVDDVIIVLTHSHYDHTSGVNWFKSKFKTKLVCQKKCARKICKEKNNKPLFIASAIGKEKKYKDEIKKFEKNIITYRCVADDIFDDEFKFFFNDKKINLIHAPGHSDGSCMILFDNKYLFTGDSLILNKPVITKFPSGNKNDYINITKIMLEKFDKRFKVLPGHGEPFYLYEYDFSEMNIR